MLVHHLLKTERIKKFKETGDTGYIYRNELVCFRHDMTYGDFKDLARRATSDKVLRDKHLILLKIQNMMGIKEVLLQWFINFFCYACR